MSADEEAPRTIADVYAGRDLSDAQVRRIVALLGLHQAVRGGEAERSETSAPQAVEAA
ncbi:hypothetical protein AB0J30_08830 [Streptomyces microflavus]|uniref:hypothetical protein n=1 Tax=Streptomyces microflavus TaxID=1919 RepID=UPI003429FE8E